MRHDEDLTLDQVRLAMPQIAGEKKKSISAITIKDVQEHFRRGSNGTVGALIKQVKIEHILAERYDMKGISQQLKAAITIEIERFVKNAEECSDEIVTVLQNDHGKICELNNSLTLELAQLNKELDATKEEAGTKEKELTSDLAAGKVRAGHLIDANSKLEAELGLSRKELSEAKQDLQDQSKQIGELSSALKAAEADRDALKEASAREQKNREEAEINSALAQEKAKMRKETISRMEVQSKKHEDKIGELESQLTKLHERLYEVMGLNQQKSTGKLTSKPGKAAKQLSEG